MANKWKKEYSTPSEPESAKLFKNALSYQKKHPFMTLQLIQQALRRNLQEKNLLEDQAAPIEPSQEELVKKTKAFILDLDDFQYGLDKTFDLKKVIRQAQELMKPIS